jgi:hypothetical protein
MYINKYLLKHEKKFETRENDCVDSDSKNPEK